MDMFCLRLAEECHLSRFIRTRPRERLTMTSAKVGRASYNLVDWHVFWVKWCHDPSWERADLPAECSAGSQHFLSPEGIFVSPLGCPDPATEPEMEIIEIRHTSGRVARNVYLERQQDEELKRLAAQQERSVSFLLRDAIRDYLVARKQSPAEK